MAETLEWIVPEDGSRFAVDAVKMSGATGEDDRSAKKHGYILAGGRRHDAAGREFRLPAETPGRGINACD